MARNYGSDEIHFKRKSERERERERKRGRERGRGRVRGREREKRGESNNDFLFRLNSRGVFSIIYVRALNVACAEAWATPT